MGGRATVVQSTSKAEGSMFVNAFLSEITKAKGVGPSVARAALSSKTTDGVVNLDADEAAAQPTVVDRGRRLRQPRARLVLSDHRLTVGAEGSSRVDHRRRRPGVAM
jgi:hypothetical protein